MWLSILVVPTQLRYVSGKFSIVKGILKSFVQQILIKQLLYVRHNARGWAYRNEKWRKKTHTSPALEDSESSGEGKHCTNIYECTKSTEKFGVL